MSETIDKIISTGQQGPSGPAGTPAPVTAANVLAAIQAMDAAQLLALRTALGFPTYADLAAANAAINNGDVFFDTSDGGKPKTATA
ncbi:hypothetical protein [Luteolibacter marinus]|uniref:hypothetical protein n=1 Tax=Luteolibacter marinus TaxID=2776705 RepID=UPI0018683ADE|nr:hypothetical protein [Luteolibacter marinus]